MLAAIVAFLAFGWLHNKHRTRKAEAELLEIDRIEVKEQLLDNDDRVIDPLPERPGRSRGGGGSLRRRRGGGGGL